MAANKLHLRIITPKSVKVDEQVDMVIMRCTDGDLGVMPDRESLSAVLDLGILRIIDQNMERRIAVFGGFAEVNNNDVTVLAYGAEWPEDIDRARAEEARERAERSLRERTSDVQLQNDQIALRRSLVRIEVSSYAVINKPS